jgi:hypothetical protein
MVEPFSLSPLEKGIAGRTENSYNKNFRYSWVEGDEFMRKYFISQPWGS